MNEMEAPGTSAMRLPLHRARRIGCVAFMGGVTLLMVLGGIGFFIFMVIAYKTNFFDFGQRYAASFWGFFLRQVNVNIIIALGAASVAYIGVAGLFGRWAGKRILLDNAGFAWIGAFTLLFPAFFATLVGINAVSLYLHGTLFFGGKNFQQDVVEPGIIFILILYLPGSIVGILSGLFTRQMGRRELEKLQAYHR